MIAHCSSADKLLQLAISAKLRRQPRQKPRSSNTQVLMQGEPGAVADISAVMGSQGPVFQG